MNYIKNHRVALLFAGVIVFTTIRIAAAFYSGYSAAPYDVFSLLFTEPIRYILIVICVIVVVIANELKRNRKVLAVVALTLLLIIGLVPTGHFFFSMNMGQIQSLATVRKEFSINMRYFQEANCLFR